MATALATCACRQGYRVRFYNAAGLVNELLLAQNEHRLLKFEKQWLSLDLVVLDELGYIPFSSVGSQLLFQFCSSRYERGSIIIILFLRLNSIPKSFTFHRLIPTTFLIFDIFIFQAVLQST